MLHNMKGRRLEAKVGGENEGVDQRGKCMKEMRRGEMKIRASDDGTVQESEIRK